MSKTDGRQARAIQGLAAALQECLDSATESSARRAGEEIRAELGPQFDRQREEIRAEFGPQFDRQREAIRAELGPRFDRQDDTLRLMWRQCGGDPNRRLPVDD